MAHLPIQWVGLSITAKYNLSITLTLGILLDAGQEIVKAATKVVHRAAH